MSPRYALTLALGAYSLFLVATLPAQRLYSWIAPHLSPVKLGGISGSIWNGHANIVNAGPGQSFQNVGWHIKPAHLLAGCVRATVTINDPGLQASGDASNCLSGNITVESAQINTDAPRLLSLFGQPPNNGSGAVSIQINSTTISDGFPTDLDGHVEWSNASIRIPDTINLGDLTAELTFVDERVKIDVADKGGPLAAELIINLDKSQEYELAGNFKPRKNAGKALKRSLDYLGSPGPEGSYKIQLSGLL